MKWKVIRHNEPGITRSEVEGEERFVKFVFNEFRSRGPDNYAELLDPEGNVVATIPADRKR